MDATDSCSYPLIKEFYAMNGRARSISLVFFVLLIAQFACSLSGSAPQPTAAQASTDNKPARTAAPTVRKTSAPPTPDIDVPDPESGTGNVVGKIVWNELPAADLEVRLCEEMGIASGCKGNQYSTQTDADGIFLFANVVPGEYALAVSSFDGKHWLYVTAGLGISAKKYTVEADQTLRIPQQAIYKFDLVQTRPEEDEKVAEARPTLEWEPYPDAAYYLVYLTQENGSPIFVNEKTETTSIAPRKDLLACDYTWQVEAYNSQGGKIAEQDGYSHFKVVDQPLSCYLDALSPLNGAAVAGSGIVLKWKAHELAKYYRVHIWDKDYTDLLDGIKVEGTSYSVPQALPAGKYKWYVTAYDEDDKQFAQSDFIEFTVTE
jgi:hypothetical protein